MVYIIVMNNNMRRENGMEIFKEVIRKTIGIILIAYCFAFAIGVVTVVAVEVGKYVQPWWIWFARLFLISALVFALIAILAVALLVIYGFCLMMTKKNRQMARKMLPEYREKYDKRAKRWNVVAIILEEIFAKAFSIFRFIGECMDEFN